MHTTNFLFALRVSKNKDTGPSPDAYSGAAVIINAHNVSEKKLTEKKGGLELFPVMQYTLSFLRHLH